MRKRIEIGFFSLLTAFALTLSLQIPVVQVREVSNPVLYCMYKLVNIISQDLRDSGFQITVLFVTFFIAYYYVFEKKKLEQGKCEKILALFFSCMYAGGRAYHYGNSLSAIFRSSLQTTKLLLLIIGFYGIFLLVITVVYYSLNQNRDISFAGRAGRFEEKHPFLFYWLVMIGIWMIHLFLRYPGLMSYDNRDELAYYYGFAEFSSIQPIFHTWLFGSIVELGRMVGHPNFGLFGFVLLQTVILSFVLAYSLFIMKKWGAPNWLRLLSLAIYCSASYYIGYITFPIKDMLYISFFMLMLLVLIQFGYQRELFENGLRYQLLLMISGTFMILFRNNGIFIYLPAVILLCIWLWREHKWQFRESLLLTIVLGLLLPVMLSTVIQQGIESRYEVQQSSKQEVFSITYQQIARYMRDYGEDLSKEERAIIRKVLLTDALPEIYNEMTADPVKSTFNWDATPEDISNYLRVWIRCFFRHPLCYAEATWNQNYYLFTPDVDNIISSRDCYNGEEIVEAVGMNRFVRFETPEILYGVSDLLYEVYAVLVSFPIIGLFSNIAFYSYGFICIIFFMWRKRLPHVFLVLFPLILSYGMIILSPQIHNQPRYAFPIIYAMPSLVGYYIVKSRNATLHEQQ